MATDSPLSEKRLTANRKNAQHSTGPRTESGKAISARNALTLGLFTRNDYVRPKEQAEYNELCVRCVTGLKPESDLEEFFVTAIVSARWRLRRCSAVEYSLVADSGLDPMQHGYNREVQNSVDRARSQASLLLRRSLLELRRLQTDRFLARKLLAHESELPPLATVKQIVTVINQHSRAMAKKGQDVSPQESGRASKPVFMGLFCETKSPTPRNAMCPCGSGEKFKRCCGQLAPPVLGPAPNSERKVA